MVALSLQFVNLPFNCHLIRRGETADTPHMVASYNLRQCHLILHHCHLICCNLFSASHFMKASFWG